MLIFVVVKYTCTPLWHLLSIISVLLRKIRIILILAINHSKSESDKYKAQAQYDRDEKRRSITQQKIDREDREYMSTLREQYGQPTTQIGKDSYRYEDGVSIRTIERIIAFEEASIIVISGKSHSFSDIISVELVDNDTQIFQKQSSTTKTSTGSMLGRAVVGGVLLGGVGAVIGGATAKKETIVDAPVVHTKHDYNVLITVNSLSNPQITLKLGEDEKTAREIASLLAVIIERNK